MSNARTQMGGKSNWEDVMKRTFSALVALAALTAIAQAQNYPTHPITMIVPFPPAARAMSLRASWLTA